MQPVDSCAEVQQRRALLLAPALVLATEYPLFGGLAALLGPRRGYFLAFVIYWVGWCFLFPLWVVGWNEVRAMFRAAQPRFGRPAWLGAATLGLPLVLAYGVAFPRAIRGTTPRIVLASLGLAAINATGEEILWRGLYRRVFPSGLWSGILWPSVGFALWHFAPQSMRPNTRPGGAWSFVTVAGLFGLGWAWLAQRSQSIPMDDVRPCPVRLRRVGRIDVRRATRPANPLSPAPAVAQQLPVIERVQPARQRPGPTLTFDLDPLQVREYDHLKGDHIVQQVQDRTPLESIEATGGQVIDTIKHLIHEGNIRRISIKQDGQTIAEFPLTFGVVGAAVAPAVAAMGAIAALVTDCTIEVERYDTGESG